MGHEIVTKTEQRNIDIMSDYAASISVYEIAKKYNLEVSTVRNIICIHDKSKEEKINKYQKVIDMFDRGFSRKEISIKLHIGYNKVRDIVDNGIPEIEIEEQEEVISQKKIKSIPGLLIQPTERGEIDQRRFLKAKIPAEERVKIHVLSEDPRCFRNGGILLSAVFLNKIR